MGSHNLSGDKNVLRAQKAINEGNKRKELAKNVESLPKKIASKIKTVPRFDKN